MNDTANDQERQAARLGGAALLLATAAFVGVFSYLAATFDYPDVLDRPASEVLPRLIALGETGRVVWVLYGLVPLLLIPTALGVAGATRHSAPLAARGTTATGALAAFSMMLGLLRWPSLQWRLALDYATADAAGQRAIAAMFDGANSYLGNFLGEFVGELFLNLFFALSAYAVASAAAHRAWVAYAGGAVSAVGLVAMFRNASASVGLVADLNNVVLPIWMAVFGVVLWTFRAGARVPGPNASRT